MGVLLVWVYNYFSTLFVSTFVFSLNSEEGTEYVYVVADCIDYPYMDVSASVPPPVVVALWMICGGIVVSDTKKMILDDDKQYNTQDNMHQL